LRQASFFVSSSDFRQIAERSDRGKKERLFRAAVTAFCSLTRPSRNEVAKLEDLVLPLYDGVSVESRRFVAAALSEIESAPAALVRRLADESVDIAAPLLLRSLALTDADLIALIGRRGIAHARVIARRRNLNQTITDLVRALSRLELRAVKSDAMQKVRPVKPVQAPAAQPVAREPGAAEKVRGRLRAMMRPAAAGMPDWLALERGPRPGVYERLRSTALTGVRALFQTALADALGIDFKRAQAVTAPSAAGDLAAALKFLDLPEEQAFVIVAALYPDEFGHAEAIRLFLRRYHLIHREAAGKVRGWKQATLAAAPKPEPAATSLPHLPANKQGSPASFGTAPKGFVRS
jgi:uncharacterized protein (DUF2336 family)